jgi:predicted P-loop ATPase
MEHTVKISVCNRKTDRKYKNQERPWSYLKDRNRNPVRTSETAQEYPKLPKTQRDAAKDQGGFVGGWLKGGIRKNGNVLCRTVGVLDADKIPQDIDFPVIVRNALPDTEYFLYSTHSHMPETPRFRVVILLAREVTEDEYPAVMRMAAKQIGMDYFDDTTYQSNRMMYWASCPSNGEFVFDENEGEPLDSDKYLSMYADWRDVTQWPTSSRESEAHKREVAHQQDPTAKDGVVGAFCRTYSVEDAIEKYLPDVYEPSAIEGRYDYTPADSSAGVVVYEGKFAYSHHASDPACGQLCNAFDLVRIHKFSDLDDKKSFKAMSELALADDNVRLLLLDEKTAQAAEEFKPDDNRKWRLTLELEKSGDVADTHENYVKIAENDPVLQCICYNELRDTLDVRGDVPWEHIKKGWSKSDEVGLYAYLSHHYAIYSPTKADNAIKFAADKRRFHPIREYLDGLPPWDGVERIPTLLVDCLQAEDNEYVRTVTKKTFAAAVARIYHPGTKFDCVLVFDGVQGIGKSSLFKDLVGDEYYSETLSLTDMDDKSGAEKLQGFWVIEIPEFAGMKKADIEKVKAFISTSDDKYRPSYGKVVESHPRQCIIIGSVNGERGYLRDITGNRRFWIVKVHQEEQVKRWHFSDDDRNQIWAEAKHLWQSGEKLYLEGSMIAASEDAQRSAMEQDERQGMVEEYLDTLLPEDWTEKDLYERRAFFQDKLSPKGTVRRDEVSNAEIWSECFGKNPAELKPADSYALSALMTAMSGWERTRERRRLPLYGQQRIYRRVTP